MRADDACIQCHSPGQPRTKPIEGVYYDWPVGYRPGDRLNDVWMLEEHHLGKETFTHWPDGNAHKNRMQGNDYVQSQMSVKGVRCYACHDVHGTPNEAVLRQPGTRSVSRATPAASAGAARHDRASHATQAGQRGQQVHRVSHAPNRADRRQRERAQPHVQVHFAGHDRTAGVPNPCTSCHTDRSTEWAIDALRKWPSVSAWRVAE